MCAFTFIYLTETFIQSEIQLRKQDQSVVGAISPVDIFIRYVFSRLFMLCREVSHVGTKQLLPKHFADCGI